VPLLDRSDSLLIVIDAQPGFYASAAVQDSAAAGRARDVAAWLAGVAIALEVPVVVTEEDPARNGPTDSAILRRLAPETQAMVKRVFGLADDPEILRAVMATGRRTAVLVGCETDVCVGQSAIGLLDRGYRVLVVSDATFSPGSMHDLGLRRIREQGGEVGHAKGVYYEWLRTLDAARGFEAEHPDLASPPGFSL
jgi:nicotinamidase-related amidase